LCLFHAFSRPSTLHCRFFRHSTCTFLFHSSVRSCIRLHIGFRLIRWNFHDLLFFHLPMFLRIGCHLPRLRFLHHSEGCWATIL
jgi:hypothetical protein